MPRATHRGFQILGSAWLFRGFASRTENNTQADRPQGDMSVRILRQVPRACQAPSGRQPFVLVFELVRAAEIVFQLPELDVSPDGSRWINGLGSVYERRNRHWLASLLDLRFAQWNWLTAYEFGGNTAATGGSAAPDEPSCSTLRPQAPVQPLPCQRPARLTRPRSPLEIPRLLPPAAVRGLSSTQDCCRGSARQ